MDVAQPTHLSGCLKEDLFIAKNAFIAFFAFLWKAWQPYGLSHIHAACTNLFYKPRDQFLKFWPKKRKLADLKIESFWVSHFDFFFASYQWKTQPIYMRYHFFLHYGWFFQNLGKEGRRIFMHTTVYQTGPNKKFVAT